MRQPGYLARCGQPVHPNDLLGHSCLVLGRGPESGAWRFRIGGKPVFINVRGPIRADSADMLLQLAIEGIGIVRLGEIAVARALQKRDLVPLLEHFEDDTDTYPLWAVLPPGDQRAPKVRVFLEFLLERLGVKPWRIASSK